VSDLKDELAEYIGLLSKGLATTSNPNDRGLYTQHLAAAAMMFFYLQTKMDRSLQHDWVNDERRNYGWSFLPGSEGNAAESAFSRFARAVENQVQEP
jgi:hypothetical protein